MNNMKSWYRLRGNLQENSLLYAPRDVCSKRKGASKMAANRAFGVHGDSSLFYFARARWKNI